MPASLMDIAMRTVVSAFALLPMTCCNNSSGEWSIDPELDEALAREGAHVKISDIARAQWGSLHVVAPYEARGVVESRLGCTWPDYDRQGVASDDRSQWLLFVRGNRVVHCYRHSRDYGDFETGVSVARANAVFWVRREGFPKIVLEK